MEKIISELTRDDAGKLHGGFSVSNLIPADVDEGNDNTNCTNTGDGDSNTNCTGTCRGCPLFPPVGPPTN